jgi:hypothetical protein
MGGYPCCLRRRPDCGECAGTAPEQYQLTVPTGTFSDNPDNYPAGCGDACDENFSGVFLLDYDPDLTPLTASDASCIWQSPAFESCYTTHGTFDSIDDEDPEPIVVDSIEWRWRVELTDDIPGDGYITAYVFLYSNIGHFYMWTGEFHLDCSAALELDWEPNFLNFPAPGCLNDPDATLTLESAP